MTVAAKIRSALLKLMKLDVGAQVDLSVERGRLVAQPATRPRKRYAIADLLEGAAVSEPLNAEVAWAREGGAVGNEIT